MSPLMRSCGPVCGMSLTAADTSTTVSSRRTPSLKSSKKRSFSGAYLFAVDALHETPAVEHVDLDHELGRQTDLVQQRRHRQVRLPSQARAHGRHEVLDARGHFPLAAEVVEDD